MRYLFVYLAILGILTGGCAVPANRSELLTEAQAHACIRAALEQELTAGSLPEYDPGLEFEAPFRQCWPSLDPVAKRVYSAMLVEAALEQGVATALAEGCQLVMSFEQTSLTGKKCRMLREAGLQFQNNEK